ncbi:BspA family leucine-rich repeat surface protein, partial [Enterococcus sp. 4E1_DIV0656]|uniref:BspA family leucine-rich repeat surface protein n=1 Tax=Enterococcus sp. 4E1_DIV0656 TaxID=1834180 RepID=UPI0015955C3D
MSNIPFTMVNATTQAENKDVYEQPTENDGNSDATLDESDSVLQENFLTEELVPSEESTVEENKEESEPDLPEDSFTQEIQESEESLEGAVEEETPTFEEIASTEESAHSETRIVIGMHGLVTFELDENTGVLTLGGGTFDSGLGSVGATSRWSDLLDQALVTKIVFTEPVVAHQSSSYLFAGFSNLVSIENLEMLDTSSVMNMQSMFQNASSLSSIDLSGWDTSSVANMNSMFSSASSLSSIDLSGFDTSSVRNMSGMFQHASSLSSIDISGWDTSSVTSIFSMFSGASNLSSIDLSGWDTSRVTDMHSMFSGASNLSRIDLSGWDTSSVTSMSGMFRGVSSLSSIDVSGFDTSRVTNMMGMFQSASSLSSIDLSGWDTSSVTSMSVVFDGASNLSSIDLSGWDTSSVTSMSGMFQSTSSLSSLDLSSFDTSYVMSMSNMFRNARSLSELKLGSDFWFVDGTSAVLPAISTASGEYTGGWSGLDTGTTFGSSATFMTDYNGEADTYVWEERPRHGTVPFSLDEDGVLTLWGGTFDSGLGLVGATSRWSDLLDQALVIKIVFTEPVVAHQSSNYLFAGFSNLVSIENLEMLDTSSVTNMTGMFSDARSLSSIDLSGWDTSSVT